MAQNHQYNKLKLEKKFANNFATNTFPLLAEIYLEEHDFYRARKVCEIGLDADSKNSQGKYILAKIELLEGNTIKAERLLKSTYESEPNSIKILKLLIEVRDFLKRSSQETKKLIDYLLKKLPDDVFANQWISNYKSNQSNISLDNNSNEAFKINSNICSITFYELLKNQKYYKTALEMLNQLKDNQKIKMAFYNTELKQIHKLLNK
tara:strand:+ start:232 stop:852 length:621 start_codon:yes stop_codon:yes gene_type:complete